MNGSYYRLAMSKAFSSRQNGGSSAVRGTHASRSHPKRHALSTRALGPPLAAKGLRRACPAHRQLASLQLLPSYSTG
ncbi:hypothetical protein OH77DRAFT_521049 [Trametes cingulata]|nr:hypothetical protein OH77DRAFT_521049 [Trametes cingulata]